MRWRRGLKGLLVQKIGQKVAGMKENRYLCTSEERYVRRDMKVIRILLGLALLLSSCSTEPVIGKWTPMKWEKNPYKTVREKGVTYYSVPAEGASMEFICRNYRPWISNVRTVVDGVEENAYESAAFSKNPMEYSNEWLCVQVVSDTVRVTFSPNRTSVKRVGLELTAGDIFDTKEFLQDSPQDTE